MLLKNFVRTLPGAEYLSEADAEHIVAAMRVDDYDAGHIFVCQDKLAKELHLLLKGRVKVSYYGSTGRNHTLRTLEPGDLFGLLSLSDGKPAVASCVAEDSVRVASLPFSAYMLLYQPHSDIGCRFQYLLAAQLARDLRYRHAMLRNQLSCLYTGQPLSVPSCGMAALPDITDD